MKCYLLIPYDKREHYHVIWNKSKELYFELDSKETPKGWEDVSQSIKGLEYHYSKDHYLYIEIHKKEFDIIAKLGCARTMELYPELYL